MLTIKNEGTMQQKMKLCDLVNNISDYDETLLLYLPKNYSILTADIECLIVDEKNFEEERDGFFYVFGLYSLIDVLENLRNQSPESNTTTKIGAIDFYIKNDAFMQL